jgi:hypothetical protein
MVAAMKHLLCLSVFVFAFTLSGCGKESDQLPVDGRDFDGVEYSNQGPYTGKVIDGYLRNARVWLDMDGDSQYTPGPLTLTLENGNDVILPSGEPTAMSGPGGVFSLDIAELEIQPDIGPDLKATDFPLYALAIPGKTLEETRNGDVTISKAYLMSAAPGVRNITPLTTLARYRSLALLFPGSGPDPTASYDGINLVQDYILANDEQGHAYARALARFMASQFPEAYNNILKAPGSDGTERYLSKPAAYLLGVSAVQNAGDVFAVVDSQVGAGGYANVDTDSLDLPEVPLDLDDPVLLTSQRIYAESKRSGTLPANRSDLIISAELTFNYREDGRLLSVSADGCMAPSMPELARLIRAEGYMVRLGTQWLPAAALSSQSAVNHGDKKLDERLVFNWDEQRIEFETTTTCHDHEGIVAGSSELGGNPEVVYSWSGSNSTLTELAATIPATGDTRTLMLETANATDGFPGYRYSENAAEKASLTFSAGVSSCTIEDDAVGADLVVSASQAYSFDGYEPQPTNFVDLALEFDNREFSHPEGADGKLTVNRLLRYGFLDPYKSSLTEVEADRGFEWVMSYPRLDNASFVPGQPNLISEAYLNKYAGAHNCGREFDNKTSAHYARVEYRYQHLSEYLTGLLQ